MTEPKSSKSSKRTPPTQGIKVRQIGATWWGQRWIEALEHLSRDYLNRLGRGRAYARAGRVHNLHVEPGKVTALVTGSEEEPYSVTLRVAMLSPTSWQKTIETMSQQAVFCAELLAGRMPVDIGDAFRASGHSLFLVKQRELETDCSCSDWANPCKHVAAVHYVLGEAFDKDPFLLFELRGRTKQQVLGALRALRSGHAVDEHATEELLARLATGKKGEESRAVPPHAMAIDVEAKFEYEPVVALPALEFRIAAPATSGAVFKQLGLPSTWTDDPTALVALAALEAQLAAGSRLARDWALKSPNGEADADVDDAIV